MSHLAALDMLGIHDTLPIPLKRADWRLRNHNVHIRNHNVAFETTTFTFATTASALCANP